jgi:hypothetical protein
MKKRHLFLYVILVIFSIYGMLLYLNPYLISKNETVTGLDIWIEGTSKEAYFYFKLTSNAFVTTN